MSLETIHISTRGKDQLVKLKRLTGVTQWNILCRWALALSLADPSVPLVRDVKGDSNVEMTWKTFGGAWADVYLAHVQLRAWEELGSTSDDAVEKTFMAHLHRGIGYLAGSPNLHGIADLLAVAVKDSESSVMPDANQTVPA
jgi:DNA sulfur modification protein DndE